MPYLEQIVQGVKAMGWYDARYVEREPKCSVRLTPGWITQPQLMARLKVYGNIITRTIRAPRHAGKSP